ncbi:MAG: type IIL restriction-modification enzyme MmeI [Pyrinomonadaceae bacterium]
MPQLTQAEIRNNAVAFVHEWKDETRERAEAQSFWNDFLEIFGVKRRRACKYENAKGQVDYFDRKVPKSVQSIRRSRVFTVKTFPLVA